MRWACLSLLALAFGCAMDARGGAGFDDNAEDPRASAQDGGGGGQGGSAAGPCESDLNCGEGYVCFRGGCVYQGVDGFTPGALRDGGVNEVEHIPTLNAQVSAGEDHVWVPSEGTDTVVRVDGARLEVEVIHVGARPTRALTRPDGGLVVLNWGSDELTLISPEGVAAFIPLGGHLNALDLDPSGRFAVAWLDAARLSWAEDAAALQDALIIDLDAQSVSWTTIGYAPSRLQFIGDEAVFITADGLSLVRLTDPPRRAPLVPLAINVFHMDNREVLLSEDGAFAVSRGPGEAGITWVALPDGLPQLVPLDEVPSDIDLLPDDRTVLAMYGTSAALIDLEAPQSPRTLDLEGHTLTAAAVGEAVAVLFSAQQVEAFALLDLETEALIFQPARKRVLGASVAPGGQIALLWHAPEPGAELEAMHGFSSLRLSDGFTRFYPTLTAPVGVSFGPAHALILIGDDDEAPSAQLIDLESLALRAVPLGRAPEAAGFLPALHRAFVTQRHAEGRVSFFSLDDDGAPVQTVSGYLLNGRIR
ncbi:hypothetical protein KKF91_21915 [Myxococcota bacterium]|nr:hypothetical protein [Myxococcota bacterium]MBU1433203.1 hypothetical protein [Myxococcota bacterium]MBU1900576.1 hypothetical protein [Myxococcota bacterium]